MSLFARGFMIMWFGFLALFEISAIITTARALLTSGRHLSTDECMLLAVPTARLIFGWLLVSFGLRLSRKAEREMIEFVEHTLAARRDLRPPPPVGPRTPSRLPPHEASPKCKLNSSRSLVSSIAFCRRRRGPLSWGLMPDPGSPSLSRRHLARTALFGGASAVLSAPMLAAQQPATSGLLDARHVGALGDGKADDTAALQRALDAAGEKGGGVFLPPGIYRSRELHVRPGVALIGVPGWNYSFGGGSVLRLADASSPGLLNLSDARGATIDGLSVDGHELGQGIHGIFTARAAYGPHEDGFRIERTQVARFSGDGLHLERAWCFSVRHCEMIANHGDGLSLRGWDGFILDNWLSGNGRAGFAARDENASVTFTANRVEWNHDENMVIVGGDGYQITGNFFDRAGTVGIALRPSESSNKRACTQVTITGNFVKRSGRFANAGTHDSAQILLEGATGVTCMGNVLQSGQDDGRTGIWSPSEGIVYRGLMDCVIANNVLHHGALRQLIVDLGGHGDGVVVRDNPGRLFTLKG